MKAEELKYLIDGVFIHIRELNNRKLQEYATESNALRNFYYGGRVRNQSPEDYLLGLKTKGRISLDDYAHTATRETRSGNSSFTPADAVSPERLIEKIRDSILYDILYLALYIDQAETTSGRGAIEFVDTFLAGGPT